MKQLLSDHILKLQSDSFYLLFARIQEITGMELSLQVMKELQHSPDKVTFAYPDIVKLKSRVRHMDIVEASEALAVRLSALSGVNFHAGVDAMLGVVVNGICL